MSQLLLRHETSPAIKKFVPIEEFALQKNNPIKVNAFNDTCPECTGTLTQQNIYQRYFPQTYLKPKAAMCKEPGIVACLLSVTEMVVYSNLDEDVKGIALSGHYFSTKMSMEFT